MPLYTLSTMVQTILEDIGVADTPFLEVITVDKIVDRVRRSTMAEFSTRYPYIGQWQMNDTHLVNPNSGYENPREGRLYMIPPRAFPGHDILGIAHIDIAGSTSFADPFIPTNTYDPATIMTTVGDIQMAADLGRFMAHAMTWEFIKPNKIKLYNGYTQGNYQVQLMLTHDDSLSTIPDTALTHLRQLMTLDIKWYLYGRFKRMQDIDTGVGTINLKLDDWSDAESQFHDLLNTFDEDGNLNNDYIEFF